MAPQALDTQTVGILGGGQLGRMIAEEANRLNVPYRFLDAASCPATLVSPTEASVVGSFKNAGDVLALAKQSDVLTVEIEHVDVSALIAARDAFPNLKIYPTPESLHVIQDKYRQKLFLRAATTVDVPVGPPGSKDFATSKLGIEPIPLPQFFGLVSGKEAEGIRHAAVERGFGYPIMVKAKRMAYDGRGNYVVHSESEVEDAVRALSPNGAEPLGSKSGSSSSSSLKAIDDSLSGSHVSDSNLYVEKMVPFTKELAVMVAVSPAGETSCYPAVETIQENNICKYVVAPAQVSQDILERTVAVASHAVRLLGSAGIFGVELFLLPDSSVVVNEIAPRPHNSGHYTMNACYTSQFQQHLRCILGLPLGSTKMVTPASVMVNLIGKYADQEESKKDIQDSCRRSLEIEGAAVHLYGKAEYKKGRKMGHINFVGGSICEIVDSIESKMGEQPLLSPLKGEHVDVGIIMGSDSDLPTMKPCAEILKQFGISFEVTIVSAHRTPQRLVEYATSAHKRGLKVVIAAAGGAAHLPGMVAAMTPLPVVGVPVALKHLDGVDSLYSIVQMPRGVPVATVAINNAVNAALLAARILGSTRKDVQDALIAYRETQEQVVLSKVEVLNSKGWEAY